MFAVLPEHAAANDYAMFNIKCSSPETVETTPCSSVTPLQGSGTVAHRYDTGYTSGGGGGYWGGTCTAPPNTHNYNYYNNPNPAAAVAASSSSAQAYPPPPPPPPPHPPPMILYPSLYSTVNQNQIHLHVHHNEIKPLDEYVDDVTTIVGNNLTISSGGSRGIEIGILQHNNQMQPSGDGDGVITRYNDRQHAGDPSVWRPY